MKRSSSWRETRLETFQDSSPYSWAQKYGRPLTPKSSPRIERSPIDFTSLSTDLGEQPLFSTKAHVFQIDPDTKKNWIPASKQSTSISYYYDNTRSSYRIIGVDGSKAVVNSVITPNMTFTKTSQKFGQWLDPKANIVYGLGFPSELDLTKFIEKFKEIKELTRQTSSQSIQEVNGGDNYLESSSTTNTAHHSRNSSISSVQSSDSGSLRERRNSFTQGGQSNSSPTNQTEVQLKYENDRLKLALAQSSGNAKKWEVELQTLKNNNARLTAALQESTSNVDEWKKQLASYKDDCSKLKAMLLNMEENKDNEDKTILEQEIKSLQEELVQLKEKEQVKDKEIDGLLTKVENLSLQDATNTSLQARIQTLEEENHELSGKVHDLQQLLEESHSSHNEENNDVLKLQEKMGSKVTELYELHEQIVSTIKKESNS